MTNSPSYNVLVETQKCTLKNLINQELKDYNDAKVDKYCVIRYSLFQTHFIEFLLQGVSFL